VRFFSVSKKSKYRSLGMDFGGVFDNVEQVFSVIGGGLGDVTQIEMRGMRQAEPVVAGVGETISRVEKGLGEGLRRLSEESGAEADEGQCGEASQWSKLRKSE
jgi:hypothetical protein